MGISLSLIDMYVLYSGSDPLSTGKFGNCLDIAERIYDQKRLEKLYSILDEANISVKKKTEASPSGGRKWHRRSFAGKRMKGSAGPGPMPPTVTDRPGSDPNFGGEAGIVVALSALGDIACSCRTG